MSRPDVASEPSMDDILASIRKIIAEEPAAVRPPPEPRAAPRAPDGPELTQPVAVQAPGQAAAQSTTHSMTQSAAFGQPALAQKASDPTTTPRGAERLSAPAPDSLSRALNGLSTSPATAAKPAAPPLGAAAAFDDLDDLLEEAPASPLRPAQGPAAAGAPSVAARLFGKPAANAATPAPSSNVSPRSFDELLRSKPAATPVAQQEATSPTAGLGDLGSVVPTRAGFGTAAGPSLRAEPPVAAPAQQAPKADPFQWSGPSFGEKAAPAAAGSPPFGASVLKAPQQTPMPTPAAEPASGGASRYEVIAAMPSPVAQPAARSAGVPPPAAAAPVTPSQPLAAEARASGFKMPPLDGPAGSDIARPADAKPDMTTAEPAPPGLVSAELPRSELPGPMPAAAQPSASAPLATGAASGIPTAAPDTAIERGGVVAHTPAVPLPVEPPASPAADDLTEATEAGFAAAAIESTAAAASALGALAAGLAASSKSMLPQTTSGGDALPATAAAGGEAPATQPMATVSMAAAPTALASPNAATGMAIPSTAARPPVTAVPPAAPVTFAAMPPPSLASAPVPAAAPAAVAPVAADPAPAPVRSLDDTVADLLRPMLRQWLAENMPRIVEKALRIEVAESVRSSIPPAKSD